MKQLISRRSFLKAAGVTAAAASMAIGAPAASACWYGDKSDVTILYTNDVHTYIDKQSPKLTYAAIADLKQSYQNAGKDVLLVDAGDHVQGTAYGSMDEGASIIKLMNAAGYDVATPGNHEFDYGMDRAKAIMKEADFPYLSCNWVDLRTTLRVLPSVKVFVRGGRRIAFVGVTTPETFTKSTPAYFMDKAQRKYIYDIQGGEDGKKLYDAVQKAIDKAKLLADVVIGLGHLGVDPSSSPWTSEEVIAHTSGFDAFIDGHSHTVMENKQVQDASGKAVTLTQTGSYFANVGEMTIAADGTITTKLIPTHEGMDAGIAAMQTGWVNTVDDMLGEKIAVGDSDFYVSDPATGKRRIRSAETNLGDFVADGIYTYFNEVEKLHCDVAIMNGGGIRADVPAGDWTFKTCKQVSPFGNVACLMSVTGKQIQDALEFAARFAGEDGKRNGKEQRFDPKSGKQIYEANYTDDRKEGKQWKISEDTTERWVSKTVSHYKNGELDGPYEYTAHLHGKLYAYKSGSYKNGYKHGSWKEIDRDDIAVQGEYTEGRETGHWIRYDIISGEILNEWDR